MVKKKCKSCGARIIEYPIWEGQEFEEPFAFNKIKWRNLLIGDWSKTLVLIALLFAVWSYNHDTQACQEIIENPCEYVKLNQLACQQRENQGDFLIPGIGPEVNIGIT